MKRTMLTVALASTIAWAAIGPLLAASPDKARSAHEPAGSQADHHAEWELLFEEGITTEEYTEQLDYFKIEIGAVSKDGRVEYISHVSQRKPDKRLGDLAIDPRVRIGWKKGTLAVADRKLLGRAGINTKDKDLQHFFSKEIQNRLAVLERAYGGREASQIKRTRFGIRPTKDVGYEFVVIEQDPPPPSGYKPAAPASSSAGSRDANR
jgi:hypothetical protein